MKKLPVLKWKTATPAQRERLARWLRERQFQLTALAEEKAPPSVAAALRVAGPLDDLVAPFDVEPLRLGEIRLLSSWLLPAAERPVYVAVLADWADELMLVAPFSPLSEPATTGEWKTGREAAGLAVLCLWNSHTVPTATLARSWIVDHLSEAERADAWTVFQHIATGKPLTGALTEQVGIPIADQDDPRLIYQREEAALLAPLVESLFAESSADMSNLIRLDNLLAERDQGEHALAAAAAVTPSVREIFEAPAFGVVLRFYLEDDLSTATLLVHDPVGQPAESLDGARVIGSTGELLATVVHGFATFPIVSARNGVSLQLESGEIVSLARR